MITPRNWLVRLRPRSDNLFVGQGRTVLISGLNGMIEPHSPNGLYFYETRVLSRWEYRIDGRVPQAVALSNVAQHTWLGYYILLPPGFRTDPSVKGSREAAAAQNTLELRVSRYVGGGVHEDIDLTNFTQQPTSFELELLVDADFASMEEAEMQRRLQRGRRVRRWQAADGSGKLVFHYTAEHHYNHQDERGTAQLHRGLEIRVASAGSPPQYRHRKLIFPVDLPPQGAWHACLFLTPALDGKPQQPLYDCRSFQAADNVFEKQRQIFLDSATDFQTPEDNTLTPVVAGALTQAKHDLIALRLHDLDWADNAWTVAAGLPTYLALFGRDSLTAAWEASLLSADLMRGTLPELARWQGTQSSDWRDEQPGRMLHEAHTDPLAVLNFNARARYYGAVTTSVFYGVVVSLLWHWTGDKRLVEPFIAPALQGLEWLDRYGDSNGDGFYDYRSRSEDGLQNQGWKDSGDAIVYEDGSLVKPATATCEEQAFAYAAKLNLSETLWWLDRKEEAKRLFHEAGELKKRFNDAYWMEDAGFFAMGLDSQSKPIRSIGSDAGHCIAAGIVDDALIARTANRLFQDDLFTGWGIRTLSSQHPAYNPYSYHRGTVWPVEHGAFAIGFFRYGLHEHVQKICRAQFEAAALFDFFRLPEAFSGHPRDAAHPFPALYPKADSPQAWSASTVFAMLQAMLGLYPYAPLHTLLLDPHLPEWLPEITLDNIHLGEAVVKIRFYRKADGASDYEVLDKRGHLHVLRQPSPWSLTTTFAERVKDLLTSLLPGK